MVQTIFNVKQVDKYWTHKHTIALQAHFLNADRAHCQQKPGAAFVQIYILCKEGASGEERLIGSGMKGQLESN